MNEMQKIAEAFKNVTSISADHAEKLLDLLDQAPAEALEMLVVNKVKFCKLPAVRRLREKFGYSEDRINTLVY